MTTSTATSKLGQVAKARKKCRSCNKTRDIKFFKRCGTFISPDGHQRDCNDCLELKRASTREAKREAARVDEANAPSVLLAPGFSGDFVARMMKIASQARGMSFLDPRLEDHANEAELLALDIEKAARTS